MSMPGQLNDLHDKVNDILKRLGWTSLEHEFDALFPEQWKKLPQTFNSVHQFEQDGKRRIATVMLMRDTCAGPVPTREEIEEFRDMMVLFGREPKAFLVRLGYIQIPEGVEDLDGPTMAEYLDPSYDPSKYKKVALLISYPACEEPDGNVGKGQIQSSGPERSGAPEEST